MIETVKLFNSKTKTIEKLQPLSKDKTGIYCCGPTVYNYQHIGNLRTYLFEDLLVRTLRFAGHTVKHVMNITDVGHLVSDADEGEDKMLLAAKRESKSSLEIAEYYTDIFFKHSGWLNIKKPDVISKATEHIDEMIELIAELISKGFAYQSGGNVYFSVDKFPAYADFAGLELENMKAGSRINVDDKKKNPYDFALWFTKSKFENQELQWDSPFGRGYPGWHIECSAMSHKYLGKSFDIHCGGIDHIPVHHTNEIAQSEAANEAPMASIWMHGGFLVTSGEKMSKSTGEFLTLDVLKDKGYDPVSYRLLCLGGSYRKELTWSFKALDSASSRLKKLKDLYLEAKDKLPHENISSEELTKEALSEKGRSHIKEFKSCIYKDLNSAKALVCLQKVLEDKNISSLEKTNVSALFDEVLGLGVRGWKREKIDIPEDIQAILKERDLARANKDFKSSDELRDKLKEAGWEVKDSKDGQTLKPI